MRIVIDLSEKDLEHFRTAMRRAREAATHVSPAQVIEAAEKLFAEAHSTQLPDFIASRMRRLDTLIGMVKDAEWRLTDSERQEILSALTYFCDPNDAIPDHIPVLGFLDDAIMIELVVEELTHEIDAYEDFLRFREAAKADGNQVSSGSLEEWLAQRQIELLERMRERRGRERHSYVGSSRQTLFRIR